MFKKIITLGLVIIMMLSFAACGEDKYEDKYYDDRVWVSVKAECKEAFLAKEISAEDFKWDNIEKIELIFWYDEMEPQIGFINIYLIKHGKKEVEAVLQHLETLSFVNNVNASPKVAGGMF